MPPQFFEWIRAEPPAPPGLSPDEQDRLLAAARARYQAGPADAGPVWTPPIEEENPV